MWDGSRRTRLPKEALRGADFEELARSGLEHPELAAHRVRRVRRSVLRRDHHAATLSYRRRRHGLERSVVLEVSDGELLGASRAHEEQALRRQVVDVVDALADVQLALLGAGLRVEHDDPLRGASDEKRAALDIDREAARSVLAASVLPGRDDLASLRVVGDRRVLVFEVVVADALCGTDRVTLRPVDCDLADDLRRGGVL